MGGGGGVACNLVAHFLDVFTLRLNALLTDLQIRGSMSDLILLFSTKTCLGYSIEPSQ